MSRVCQLTGKRTVSGNNVSHAQNKVKRTFRPNLHTKKYWVEAEKKYVTLKLSSRAIRTIDKIGLEAGLKKIKALANK